MIEGLERGKLGYSNLRESFINLERKDILYGPDFYEMTRELGLSLSPERADRGSYMVLRSACSDGGCFIECKSCGELPGACGKINDI